MYTYLGQTAYQCCTNCIPPPQLYVNNHPSPFFRPFKKHLLWKVNHKNWVFMCMTFPILWKCTIILLIRRATASASQARSPGADVTKFKSVQNTFFGRHEGNQILVKTTKVTLNAKSIWTRSLLCWTKLAKPIFISLKALCHSYHQCRMSRRHRWFQPIMEIQIQFNSFLIHIQWLILKGGIIEVL